MDSRTRSASHAEAMAAAPAHLAIRLLGHFDALAGHQALTDKLHRKTQALVAYLAHEAGRRYTREFLAALLWPRLPMADARTNLRQALFQLHRALGTTAAHCLQGERDHVQLLAGPWCWVDVHAIQDESACHSRCLESAPEGPCSTCLDDIQARAALYQGDFLKDFALQDAPEFELWCDAQRETLRCQAMAREEFLCNARQHRGELELALQHALRCTQLDPWNETCQHRYVQLLTATGRAGAAVLWSSHFHGRLATEINAEPAPASAHPAVYGDLQDRAVDARSARPDASATIPEYLVGPAIQRRLVTVLCYHTQPASGAEPEAREELAQARLMATRLLRTRQACVTQGHDGHIFVYLGYPRCTEQVAPEAVEVAQILRQNFVPQFAFSAGICTGIIITSRDIQRPELSGSVSRTAYDLCEQAPESAILLCSRTLGLLQQQSGRHARPARRVAAGDGTAGESYLLLDGPAPGTARDTAHDTLPMATQMLGREPVLKQLLQAWKQACQGKFQRLLLLGETGIGKSRLVDALRGHITQATGCVCVLHGQPGRHDQLLHPFRELLGAHLGLPASSPPESGQNEIEGILKARYPQFQQATIDMLRPLLYDAATPHALQQARIRRADLMAVIAGLLKEFAARRPLLLIIEDLQWLDIVSQEVVATIAQQKICTPTMVLLTARERPSASWLNTFTSIQLPPLTEAGIARILKDDQPALPTHVLRTVVKRADGIPWYAQELAREALVADRHSAHRAASDPQPPAPQPTEIVDTGNLPVSLHYVVQAQLDAADDALRVMRLAAIIGPRFDLPLLAQICNVDEQALGVIMQRLLALGIVNALPGVIAGFQFRRVLTHEVLYSSMLAADREEVHLHIARALERHFPQRARQQADSVARHYAAAGHLASSISWWLLAGHHAIRVSAFDQAETCLRAGLALIPDLQANETRDTLERSLLLPLAQVLLVRNDEDSRTITRLLGRALALSKPVAPPYERIEMLWGQWLLASTGKDADYRKAATLADELLQLAMAHDEPGLLAEAHAVCARTFLWVNHLEAVVQHGLASLAAAPGHTLPLTGAHAHVTSLSALSWAYARLGQRARMQDCQHQAIRLARRLQHPNSLCQALFFAALLASLAQDADAVERLASEMTLTATQHRLSIWKHSSHILHGWLQAFEGNHAGPAQILPAAHALQRKIPGLSICALMTLAHAHELLHQHAPRELAIDWGLQAANATNEGYFKAMLLEMQRDTAGEAHWLTRPIGP
ncbi:AAA family ATPase [Castellaniella sp.]|uniref:AAA family ATPase n=2 Tax=Castellaniella sp. TaxID=1955812 RepID=UPI0035604AB1